ncbi:MAG: cupin domain-containing protein [Candidatus Omnitrophota bacterium]|nr:cupin domain-containing protein [Candidatus Omnitrophota bacterium]
MDKIIIEKPDDSRLEELGVSSWPVWRKEVSRFPWSYDEQETCYILEGSAKVEPDRGESVEFGAGDMVIFPKGMNCTWEITAPIRKHYKMG